MVVSAFVQSTRALLAKFGVDAPDIRIAGLTLDSREVNPRLAFVALKGHNQDGRDFIPQAISLGARVILAQTEQVEEHGALQMRGNSVIVSLYDLPMMLSPLAAAFYDYPANKMATVAVTGTNGKTSVVQLITQLKHHLGNRCAAIGTLGSGVYEGAATQWRQTPDGTTTPDAIRMQYLLAEFVQLDVAQVAFEASSHAIAQGRLSQIHTDTAVFTNLSRDHLDYHQTMEAYGAAKRDLLNQPGLKTVVLNADDIESQQWAKQANSQLELIWTSLNKSHPVASEDRHCLATNVQYHNEGCQFELETSWGSARVELPLLGTFNVYNTLSAVATLLGQGERFDEVVAHITALLPVPGRMEVFTFAQHANVVVDYAHTPDALEKLLSSARQHCTRTLWCVFGCGGDRDKGKRPLMGEAARRYADVAVITTDNSRSESQTEIAKDILAGMTRPDGVICEPDREAAIRYCLDHAEADDLIVVAGKGHESYQIIGTQRTNYNERAVVARLQQEYSK